MTTIFDATRPTVKSTRRFGAGLLRSTPVHRLDHTLGDERWLAADNARRAADRLLDQRAAEAEAEARLEAGILL